MLLDVLHLSLILMRIGNGKDKRAKKTRTCWAPGLLFVMHTGTTSCISHVETTRLNIYSLVAWFLHVEWTQKISLQVEFLDRKPYHIQKQSNNTTR